MKVKHLDTSYADHLYPSVQDLFKELVISLAKERENYSPDEW
jgi:hypothetical protein